jgi:hypothetical protein
MRGLTILFVTFAALLMMRGQHQPNFVLLPTAPERSRNPPVRPPARGTKVPSGPDLDQAGAVAGAAILSFSSVQVLRTSAVISEQSSI